MPKIVDHKQYRKKLLDKCFGLLAQKGYGSITMRQIAEGLGVSTGTLYHYFPSKQALFEQLAQEICEQDVSAALAELEGGQTLQEEMEALGTYLMKNEDYFIKWAYICIDFCQHQNSKEMLDNSVFKLPTQRYQEAAYNFFGIKDSVLACFLLSFINGLILEKLWGNETIDFIEQCALLGKMLTVYLPQHTA
ncbi:MAG: TetR/AcrR family transcriptional regulator [Nostoc indistinguendum CM1-VF10]|jgi:AcrR family transcriptional regulator|nr:TetR/AcrR family transcriptional regulator [Nostoc indistinguendum CM1-VF10]